MEATDIRNRAVQLGLRVWWRYAVQLGLRVWWRYAVQLGLRVWWRYAVQLGLRVWWRYALQYLSRCAVAVLSYSYVCALHQCV
jgi:hypothetical protein